MSNNFVDLTGDAPAPGDNRADDPSASAPTAAAAASLPDLYAPLAINMCSDILDIDGGPDDTILPELTGLAEAVGRTAAAAAQSNKANQPPKFRPKKPKSRENSVSSSNSNNNNNSVGGVKPAPLSRDTSVGDGKLPASMDGPAKKKRKRKHSREKKLSPRSVSGGSQVPPGHNLAVRSESGGSAGRLSQRGRGYKEGGRGRADYSQRNFGRGSAAGRGGGNTAGRIAGRGLDPRYKQGRGRGERITLPTAKSARLEACERELEARRIAFDKKCRDSESEIAAKRQELGQLREKNDQEILQLRRNAECEIARFRKDNEREMEQLRSENEREMQRLRAKNEQEIERRTKASEEAYLKLQQRTESLQRDLEKLHEEYYMEKDNQRRELDVARQEFQVEMDVERRAVETSRIEFEKEAEAVRSALETQRQELEYKAQLQQEEERYLEAEAAEQRSREESFTTQKGKVEASLRQKQDLLDIREKSQQRKALELSRLQKALETTKAKQQKEFQEWAVSRARQQEEAEEWISDAKSENAKRRSELEARAAALTRQQKELEVRAAAQRKRAKGLKAALQANARKPSDGDEDAAKPECRNTNDVYMASEVASKPSGRQHFNGLKDNNEAEGNEQPSGKSDGCDFVLLDSESEEESHDEPAPEPRQQYRFNYQDEYNYNFSTESASEIQDRLFREAAEKMRAQATARVASGQATKAFEFSAPVFNIAERYPNHWKWKSPHAVLGLPPNATMKLIKSQYRRLARTYHPDKSTVPNSAAKFHSISTAYHKILQHE